MAGPKNASIGADGFRFYEWAAPGQEPVKVLSVTSIKKLCGESFQLVAWQISNVVNLAMGTTKRTWYGPRGGKHETYVQDGEFPGPFVQRLLATEGGQAGLDETRKWLRDTADRPRDTAAVRGTIVHEAIELGAKLEQIDLGYVEAAVLRLSANDQRKMKAGVQDEDVEFVQRAMANYWDMRVNVPFVILAREVQVWNLTAGYGGQADALVWFLGEFDAAGEFVPLPEATPERVTELKGLAKAGAITQNAVAAFGGHVTLTDWKTGSGPFTDQVVQVTAYLGTEFVGSDGVVDERLTKIINAATEAAIIFVRPEGWAVYFLDWQRPVMFAFLGSVAYARFLSMYRTPDTLFTHSVKGSAVHATQDSGGSS